MSIQTSRVVHLNRYYHFTELMRDPAIEAELRRYKSDHDGTSQTTLVLRPTAQAPDKLFFFFHGMDGDSGDGVIVRNLVKDLNATVVAMGGRGPAWLSDSFLADAEQVIRTYVKSSQSFYLIGVSMGGTQALSLAGLLPEDLRRLILGVVALIPGVNLPAILANSANDRVRNTLRASINDASVFEQRSPTNAAAAYEPELPFVIFHNHEDTLLLSDELKVFVANLRRAGHKVTTFSAPGDHNFTYEDFDFAEAVSRLGSDGSEAGPPLISAAL
jgi:pimeloyl-ACP methyl ester carboxylesterase